jgi:hypothetical protein
MSTADVDLEPHGSVERRESAADTDVIARSFMRYVETFQQLDLHATLRHLHVPFVFIEERLRVSSTSLEIEAIVATIMRDLASRAYARSEIDELYVYRLSDHAAVVSCSRTRYAEHGDEMERLGETYTLLRRSDDEWRIAVAIVHAADRVLRARSGAGEREA